MTEEQTKKAIYQLVELIGKLGWDIAVEESDPSEPVSGMIIGDKEYIEKIMTVFSVINNEGVLDVEEIKKDSKSTKGIF